MQLSEEDKHFYHYFAAFLKSSLNIKYFGKNDVPHRKFNDTNSDAIVS